MRSFFRTHWKVIVAIVLLILLAMVTVNPSSAVQESASPSLAARLRAHVAAIAPDRPAAGQDGAAQDSGGAQAPDQAAAYIENVLGSEGYRIRRQGRSIEVSVAHADAAAYAAAFAGSGPARIFIIGARYDAVQRMSDDGSGLAAVLELARLLKDLRPSRGTEVKFVFSADEARAADSGNFIAFAGTLASTRLVQDALSAFQAAAAGPARGLAAPAYVQGVTLLGHPAHEGLDSPAVMVTESGFMRYPYHRTGDDAAERFDVEGVARVVGGLARTITALAAGART